MRCIRYKEACVACFFQVFRIWRIRVWTIVLWEKTSHRACSTQPQRYCLKGIFIVLPQWHKCRTKLKSVWNPCVIRCYIYWAKSILSQRNWETSRYFRLLTDFLARGLTIISVAFPVMLISVKFQAPVILVQHSSGRHFLELVTISERGSVTAPQSQESIHSHTLSQIQTSLDSSCAMHSNPRPFHSCPACSTEGKCGPSPDVSALHVLASETQILINQICPHVERKRSVCHLYKKQSHFEIESEIWGFSHFLQKYWLSTNASNSLPPPNLTHP